MHRKHKRLLAGIGACIVVLGGVYGIASVRSQAKLKGAYAALEKDGRPMKAAEVIPAEIPDAQNAAILFEQAAELLKKQPAPKDTLLDHMARLSYRIISDSMKPEDVNAFRQLMQQPAVVSALETVAQGTQRSMCRLSRDYQADPFEPTPAVRDIRALGQILGAKACLEGRDRQTTQAWNTVRIQISLAGALQSDPGIMAHLAYLTIVESVCKTVRELCETSPLPAGEVRKWETVLRGLNDATALSHAVDGERLLRGEWFFNQPEERVYAVWQKTSPGMDSRLLFRFILLKPRYVGAHAAYLRLMHQCAQEPLSSADASKRNRIEDVSSRYMLTGGLGQETVFCMDVYSRMVAEVNIACAGLAVLEYKQVKGRFPPTLDTLAEKDLTDPFSQQSLCYRTDGKGFVVYSVGPDHADNGGVPKGSREKTAYDIVWQFPRQGGSEAAPGLK